MFKTIWVIRFREGVDPEDALRHWRENHATLMLQIPGVVRYVQSRAIEHFSRGFDGVAELWFEDREAYEAAIRTPEWVAAVEDNKRFLDVESIASAVVEQVVVKES
jgi:uncharacterized protein (TIGR02118 family)